MRSYIVKRILISILLLFLISVFAFSMMHILPGDPARLALGYDAKEADVEALREQLNLNKPILVQYLTWVRGILRGDFGMSIMHSRPVLDILRERLPKTLGIGIPALVLSSIVGVLFGIISANKREKFIDKVISLLSTIGIGTPVFWIGIFCVWIFGIYLHVLPIQGYVPLSQDPVEYARHAIMPVFALSLGMIATLTRQTRSNMLDVINQDYIRTARANGLSEGRVIYKHALKNTLIPIITIIAMQVRMVVGGTLLVEAAFNIPGIGLQLTQSILNRDYLIVQACVMIVAATTIVCNLIVDICYGIIDPHVRLGRR